MSPSAEAVLFNAHIPPRFALTGSQTLLPLQYPGSIVLLGNGHARMSKEPRYLFKRHAGQQVFNGERIPHHVEMSRFSAAVDIQEQPREDLNRLRQDFGKNLLPV
jgi:hypothetical protein